MTYRHAWALCAADPGSNENCVVCRSVRRRRCPEQGTPVAQAANQYAADREALATHAELFYCAVSLALPPELRLERLQELGQQAQRLVDSANDLLLEVVTCEVETKARRTHVAPGVEH